MSDTTLPDKIYVCPACGQRYDEPTMCANGHAPTAAVEYDRALVEAADTGDTDAAAKIAAIELAATGGTAGVVPAEATPPGALTVPPPVPAEPVAADPAADTPAPDPAPDAPAPADGGTPPGGMTDVPPPVEAPPAEAPPVEAPPVEAPPVGVAGDALDAIENAANDVLAAVTRARQGLGL
jgi:hypothetical protein